MLGADARRVAGVAVAEVVVMLGLATALGAILSTGVLDAIRASLPEGIARWIAGWPSLRVDRTAVASGVAIGAAVTAALATVVAAASLRSSRGQTAGTRHTRHATRGRRLLVASEVALASALLLGASVMVAGFSRMAAAFETLAPARLLRFTLTLPESRYPDDVTMAAFHRTMLERLGQLPEVETSALIRNEPASNVPNPIVPLVREGFPPAQASELPRIDVEVVSPAAFAALHLDIAAGRALADSDSAGAPRVAVISRTAARRFWIDRDPVGATIRLGTDARPVRIVGVAADFTLNWYDPEMRPIVYLPDAQSPARTTSVLLRTKTDPMSLARQVRAAIAQIDDRQPISGLEPLSTSIADSLSPVKVIERLLLVAAALASALAVLGIYGVLAHWVGARRRELGVRFALGATTGSIARLVMREAALTAVVGIVAGLAIAAGGVRFVGGAFVGIPSIDLRMAVTVAAAAFGLAIAAALGPAHRAARVDVAELLRLE
jgi:putative ABC transport system permease protein